MRQLELPLGETKDLIVGDIVEVMGKSKGRSIEDYRIKIGDVVFVRSKRKHVVGVFKNEIVYTLSYTKSGMAQGGYFVRKDLRRIL